MEIKLNELQKEIGEWRESNFGPIHDRTAIQQALGAGEELGEFYHAVLKKDQGIRNDQDHDAAAKDAIGDVVLFLMNYCNCEGWSFNDIIRETADEVLKRERKDQLSRS